MKIREEYKEMSLGELRKILPLKIREIDKAHVEQIKMFREMFDYENVVKVAYIKEIEEKAIFDGNHLIKSMENELNNKMVSVECWIVDTKEECEELAFASNITLSSSRYDYAIIVSRFVRRYGKEEAIKHFDLSSSIIDDYCLIAKVPFNYKHLLIKSIATSRATAEHPLTNEHVKIIDKYFGIDSKEAVKMFDFLEDIGKNTRLALSSEKCEYLCQDKFKTPEKNFNQLHNDFKRREREEQRISIDKLSKEHYESYETILKSLNPPIEKWKWAMDLGASTKDHDFEGRKIPSTSKSLFKIFDGKVILFGNQITNELEEYALRRGNVEIPVSITNNWGTYIPHHLSVNKEIGVIIWDQLSWTVSPNLIDVLLYKRPNSEIILTILNPFRKEQCQRRHKPESLAELFGSKFLFMKNFDDYLNEFSKLLKTKNITFKIVFRNSRLILAILKKQLF